MYSLSERKNIFSDDEEDDFDFKYVPVDEFRNVVKSVKRRRTKDTIRKECITLAKQQIDRQSNLNNDYNDLIHNQSRNLKVSGRVPHSGRGKAVKNILLTIPEESSSQSSLGSFKSKNTQKSKPPLEMSGESCYKFLRHVIEDTSSDGGKSVDLETLAQPDLQATYQVLTAQRKISDLLDEISHRLNNIPLPDGECDLQRRQQRILEFSVRFSRNYLYDLTRQIADIRRHMNVVLDNEGLKYSKRGLLFHRQIVEQKLVLVHQLLLNALSIYCRHIPNATLKGQPGKLKDVLQMVIDLKEICTKINLTPECMEFGNTDDLDLFQGKDIEDKCLNILLKMKLNSNNESPLITQTAKSPTSLDCLKKRNQKRVQSSLYKYNKNSQSRKHRMRKTAAIYQKTRKHQSLQTAANKKLNDNPGKSARDVCREPRDRPKNGFAKIQVPPKEDDIQTMMDIIETDTDDESNTESPNPITGIVVSEPYETLMKKLSSKLKLMKNNKNDRKFTDQDLLNAVPLFSNLMSMMEEKNIQNATNNTNMKLLHLQQERETAKTTEVSCQVSCDDSNKPKKTAEIVLSVEETAKNTLLDYKNAHQLHLSANSMYFNNNQNKPWELVCWVAEKLVDEMIVEVSKEFEIDGIIKKMFDLEFVDY